MTVRELMLALEKAVAADPKMADALVLVSLDDGKRYDALSDVYNPCVLDDKTFTLDLDPPGE